MSIIRKEVFERRQRGSSGWGAHEGKVCRKCSPWLRYLLLEMRHAPYQREAWVVGNIGRERSTRLGACREAQETQIRSSADARGAVARNVFGPSVLT